MATQATLDGVIPPVIPELTQAAENYVAVRDERMKLTKEEVAKRTVVVDLMKSNSLTSYQDNANELTIVLETKTKVKVKIGGEEPEED